MICARSHTSRRAVSPRAARRGLPLAPLALVAALVCAASPATGAALAGASAEGAVSSPKLSITRSAEDIARTLQEARELAFDASFREAMQKYMDLVALGHAPAMTEVGRLHEAGSGRAASVAEALRWYRRAMQAGDIEAAARVAFRELDAKTLDAGVSRLRQLQQGGSAYAAFALALLQDEGRGVARDEMGATQLLEVAARAGLPEAQLALGRRYAEGRGIEQHWGMAVLWLQEAARAASVEAQVLLGKSFRDGWGVERDELEAAYWFEKAADHGNAQAMTLLADLHIDGQRLGGDYLRAVPWLRRAAGLNESLAKFRLGLLILEQKVPGADTAEGMSWLGQAAAAGVPDAKEKLMQMSQQSRSGNP